MASNPRPVAGAVDRGRGKARWLAWAKGLGRLRVLLLVLLFPLALLIAGWSLRGLPGLPLPQTRPGRLPEAHWEAATPPPLASADLGLVAAGGRLYALGGDAPGGTATAVYDPATDRWEQGPALPRGRRAFRAAALGEAIFVVGGSASGQGETDAVELLAPGSDRWQAVAPLPAPRSGHAVVAAGGRLYALGGTSGGAPVSDVDVYDQGSGAWRRETALPTPRAGLAAAVLGGRIYTLGGEAGGAPSTAVEIYDPATGAWAAGPPLPAPLAGLDATDFNGRIHAVQGEAHLVYEPRSDRWLAATGMAAPRRGARLAALGERLYAFGGTDPATGAGVGPGERYEPGPPPEEDPFRALGFDRAGATSVVLGLLLTATLVTIMMRAGRHRPAYNRDDPWPDEPAAEYAPPEGANAEPPPPAPDRAAV